MVTGRSVPIRRCLSGARQRTFTAQYKLDVVAAHDAAPDGQKGAVLRREGLYSSHIVEWRRARDSGAAQEMSSCCALGSGTGYENCSPIEVYNCCFSSELLRRELSWTREDPLLGYLLWTGPYSAPGRGVLTTRLDPPAFDKCMKHLQALASLRHRPVAQHRGDIIGRLALLFSEVGRAVEKNHGALVAEGTRAHPLVGRAMHVLEADIARRWTLTSSLTNSTFLLGILCGSSRPQLGCRRWLTWPECAWSTLRYSSSIPTSRSPVSDGRLAGRTKTTSPVGSRLIMG